MEPNEPVKHIVNKCDLMERLMTIAFGEKITSQPQKPGKRIVSKAEYVRVQVKQAHKSIQATSFLFIGLFCIGLAAVVSVVGFVKPHYAAIALLLVLLFGSAAYRFLMRGITTFNQWESVEVVPLTRANAADLPVLESLVRASDEPMQEQATILLRATNQGQETPPEQLVRPAEVQT